MASPNPPPYSQIDRMSTSLAPSTHKIIAGVDLGTTYTGVSYASTEGAHEKTLADINVINDWPGPGRHGDYASKTPSRIAYHIENQEDANSFGFQVLPKMMSYTWFKLLLDLKQAEKFDDPTLSQTEGQGVLSKPFGKTPTMICADYLAEVAKHAYAVLVKRMNEEIVQETPFEFWFTVPAVWSDKAKSDTRQAAQLAAKMAKLRFHPDTQIFLIPEPEAAAIAAISGLSMGGSEHQIKRGDSVLVCDCGGGTVDITTYKVEALSPKLVFKELIAGTGGKCGSTYIDREFIKWMQDTFGNAYKSLSPEKRGPSGRLMKDFENHKRDFGKPKASGYFELDCIMKGALDSSNYDSDEGVIKISQADMKGFFRPVEIKIIDLLNQQLAVAQRKDRKLSIKTMLLVGGFGDSVYLNDVLRKWCNGHKIKLICPEQPQAAIVRGAALAGLNDIKPTSRRARRHYGFQLSCRFDPAIHLLEDRYYDEWDGFYRARGCVVWKLGMGEAIDEKTIISQGVSLPVRGDDVTGFTAKVYECDLEAPPKHIRGHGARKLVQFDIDLTGVDLSKFESRLINGRRMRQVDCEYHVRFGAKRGELEFSVKVGEMEAGKSTVTFDGADGNGEATGAGGGPTCAMQ